MSKKVTIAIEKRENPNSRSSKQLRKQGFLPASISSKGKDSISVAVKRDEIVKSLSKYGRNYLFNLDLEGKENITAMVKNMYYSPINRDLITIDFQQISLDEEIKIKLDVRLVGREAVEFKKMLVMLQMDQIPVSGLPQNIPDYLEIDVTDLDADDRITIADVKFPEGITPEEEADKIVLTISRPKGGAGQAEGAEAESDSESEEGEAEASAE